MTDIKLPRPEDLPRINYHMGIESQSLLIGGDSWSGGTYIHIDDVTRHVDAGLAYHLYFNGHTVTYAGNPSDDFDEMFSTLREKMDVVNPDKILFWMPEPMRNEYMKQTILEMDKISYKDYLKIYNETVEKQCSILNDLGVPVIVIPGLCTLNSEHSDTFSNITILGRTFTELIGCKTDFNIDYLSVEWDRVKVVYTDYGFPEQDDYLNIHLEKTMKSYKKLSESVYFGSAFNGLDEHPSITSNRIIFDKLEELL
jgi:hypothetical protein